MSKRSPTVRQISWLGAIPQFVALVVAIVIATRFSPSIGYLYGAAAYLLYSFGSRQLITRDHRAGISLVKEGRFEEAIPRFQASLEFMERYPWVDRYRSLVLMSASAMSFRKMALANIGFAYTQIGRRDEARSYYEECLKRFPDSGLATAALKMMDAGRTVE